MRLALATVLAALLFAAVPVGAAEEVCAADPAAGTGRGACVDARERAITINTTHVEYDTGRSSSCRAAADGNHTRFDPLVIDLNGDARCVESKCGWTEGADGRRVWRCEETLSDGCSASARKLLDQGKAGDCAVDADLDGDGASDASVKDRNASAAIGAPKRSFASRIDGGNSHVQGDLDGDGTSDVYAGPRQTTSRVEGPDLDGDGAPDLSWSGDCANAPARQHASCSSNGPAGWGMVAHEGLPPRHSNVVLADLDRDGALDIVVVENGGRVYAWTQATGPLAL